MYLLFEKVRFPKKRESEGEFEVPKKRAFQVTLVLKNPPARAGDIRKAGLIAGSGRSPGGRHSNPLKYPCLENPMDRRALWAPVHRVTQSQTR